MNKTTLIQMAGVAHLGLIAAGLTMAKVVDAKNHLQTIPLLLRRLFWTYYMFIGFVILSFGTINVVFARELAGGTNLARGVCGFMGAFWLLRLLAGATLLDESPYLTNNWRKAGYYALYTLFFIFTALYGYLAIKGGAL